MDKLYAFPQGYGGYSELKSGMTLRDYFAAKAMQSIISVDYGSTLDASAWAKYSYAIADSMLKQREECTK